MIATCKAPTSSALSRNLDVLMTDKEGLSNSMFQLALTLARIATETGSETYKTETAYALIGLIRSRPKDNIVQMFCERAKNDPQTSIFQKLG